jgi:hypothetical protein
MLESSLLKDSRAYFNLLYSISSIIIFSLFTGRDHLFLPPILIICSYAPNYLVGSISCTADVVFINQLGHPSPRRYYFNILLQPITHPNSRYFPSCRYSGDLHRKALADLVQHLPPVHTIFTDDVRLVIHRAKRLRSTYHRAPISRQNRL